jgi:hypothetical protein
MPEDNADIAAADASAQAVDTRGVLCFLAITFGLTYAVEFVLIASGFRLTGVPALAGQLAVAAVMWVPALATFITIRFVTGEGFGVTMFRFGSWRPYVATAVLVPMVFAVIYVLSWSVLAARPDWQLSSLAATLEGSGADVSSMPEPEVLLPVLLVASLLGAPLINSLFGLGEEVGWRGYLLPKLMPLGKLRAYVAVGVVWGMWHAPLVAIGFNYPGHPLLGIVAMMGLTTSLSVFINEMTLHYRSTVLAGWIHGVFNAQAYGIWRVLFPGVNPLLGGVTGVIAMAVWLVVGLATALVFARRTHL